MKALLSIKPEFVDKIFSGEKCFEYRKITFSKPITTVVIYATSPVRRIVGEFDVAEIIEEAPSLIWERTQDASGISESFFFEYFKGRTKGIAIKIANIRRYKEAINPYEVEKRFVAPQSFRYLPCSPLEPLPLSN